MFVFSQNIIVAYLLFVTIPPRGRIATSGRHRGSTLPGAAAVPPWHHTSQRESLDKNFAIHFPWIDRIFGTYYFPEDESWPEQYGLDNEQLPPGFWAQTFYPFTRPKRAGAS